MKTVAIVGWCLCCIVGFLGVGNWLDLQSARQDVARRRADVTLWQAKAAEAAMQVRTDSVEVVKWATRTKTLTDTIDIHDTVQVRELIYQTDTLRVKCLACTASASLLKVATDSVDRKWKAAYDSLPKPRLRDRCGIVLGVGALRDGTAVRAGPTLSVGCRAWP